MVSYVGKGLTLPQDGAFISGEFISYEGLRHAVEAGLRVERRRSKNYATSTNEQIAAGVEAAVSSMSNRQLVGVYGRLMQKRN